MAGLTTIVLSAPDDEVSDAITALYAVNRAHLSGFFNRFTATHILASQYHMRATNSKPLRSLTTYLFLIRM